MNILIVLIPFASLLVLFFFFLFVWATFNDQFEDIETPPLKILADEETFCEKERNKNGTRQP